VILFWTKKQPSKIFVFLNSNLLTQIDIDGGSDALEKVFINEDRVGNISSIYYLDNNEEFKKNILQYIIIREEISKQEKTKVWVQSQISHQILNQQY
jgi:hypothetical protein